jgi:site-specific DNA-methyltransferase (adenine-specific)
MLTKRQKQILDYIKEYIKKNDYAPTLEEIKKHFRLSSISTVHQHLENLETKGYLIKSENQPRSIQLIKKKRANLIEIVEDSENIEFPQTQLLLKPSGEMKEKIGLSKIKRTNDLYLNAKFLKRERKVKNRELKEKNRGGTKYYKESIFTKEPEEINKFINKIICGDSEYVLKQFPNDSIDIIITSPPYNFGLEYENDRKNDAVKWDEYFRKLNNIWKECVRVLKPGGRLCVNIQPLFSDYIPTHHLISKQLLDLGLLWKGEILWDKHNYNCKYTAWGSWKSPSMPYLKYTWEFIEIFCKKTHKKIGNPRDIDITADQFKKWVYARWDIAPERNMKKYNHPAMFPEELVVRLLKLFSYKNDIVLDPFNGVGTTTAVAKRLNRRYIGIDISEEYCKTAIRRLNETLF